jgi:hypothetical protein
MHAGSTGLYCIRGEEPVYLSSAHHSLALQKPTPPSNMFSRLATLLPIAALVAVAAAAPNAVEARDETCSTSNQSCCNTDQLAVRHLFPPFPLDD